MKNLSVRHLEMFIFSSIQGTVVLTLRENLAVKLEHGIFIIY